MSKPLADWIIEEEQRQERREAEGLLRWIEEADRIRNNQKKEAKRLQGI